MRLLAIIPCRLLLTGKYFAVGDNIRNNSECVPPGIELEICEFMVNWKPILTFATFGYYFAHDSGAGPVKRANDFGATLIIRLPFSGALSHLEGLLSKMTAYSAAEGSRLTD